MRRSAVFVVAAIFLFSAVGLAQSGYKLKVRTFAELANEQRRIVLGYCRADFEGARLIPNGFERMKPFVSYRANPEFGGFQVVSRFEVPLPEQPNYVVSAMYRTVGRWDNHGGWTAQIRTDVVQFRIIERDGELMINEVEPGQPMVSARAALAYLKQQLQSVNSEIERSMMQKGIDALTAIVTPTASQSSSPVTNQ